MTAKKPSPRKSKKQPQQPTPQPSSPTKRASRSHKIAILPSSPDAADALPVEPSEQREVEHRPDPLVLDGHGSAGSSGSPLADLLRKSIQQVKGVQDNSPHVIVTARAGTGKTTTLVEGLKVLKGIGSQLTPSPQQQAVWDAISMSPPESTCCFVAFNKSIATELQQRVPSGCDAMTMHSLGYKAVTKALRRQEPNSFVVQDIIAEVLEKDVRWLKRERINLLNTTEKLVGLCKQNLTDLGFPGTMSESRGIQALAELCERHDIDLNGDRAEVFDLVPRVLERCKEPKGKISFDDMIWLPIVLNLPVQQYDLLLVDECQDLNRCQQALAKRAGRRLILCGDDKQAIYGFAGADSESMLRMRDELAVSWSNADIPGPHVIILPLTVTRRCGKAIVKEAQRYVPDFEAHESNPEGSISRSSFQPCRNGFSGPSGETVYTVQVQDGDFILCRCNTPLVSECFRFIKAGRRANIQGRDVGAGLISTLRKLVEEEFSPVAVLIGKLSDWLAKETEKENAKRNPSESRLQGFQDKHDCLMCFTSDANTVADVVTKINAVFTDDKTSPGIKLSSIHKAKGLEAKRVFLLLGDGKRSFGPPIDKLQEWEREQEKNLLYVAVTRAIEELIYVS